MHHQVVDTYPCRISRTQPEMWGHPTTPYLTALLLLWLIMIGWSRHVMAVQPLVHILPIEGSISPATSDYVERAISQAEIQGVKLIILRLDTPGGLDSAMRTIIKRILAATIPIVAYVGPSGARAASAGTYILYASHIAAMAPGTNLGAATPIEIADLFGKFPTSTDKEHIAGPVANTDKTEMGGMEVPSTSPTSQQQSPSLQADAAPQAKLINDAVAYLQGLAKLRNRNAIWAEQAVRKAASLPSEQAKSTGVVELIAVDVNELLRQLDGMVVNMPSGAVTLRTTGLEYVHIEPNWGNRLLAAVSNPTIAYIMLLLGIYGLIYEFANPGVLVPGTTGAIFLLLAFYALQMLPLDYAGLAFMLLGLLLMAAEAIVPSFGTLRIGGTVAFAFGSLILIDTNHGVPGISSTLIITIAVPSAILILLLAGLALRAQRRPVRSGEEELLGATATVVEDWLDNEGTVRLRGELWSARSDRPLRQGQLVRVTSREGLFLWVTIEHYNKVP